MRLIGTLVLALLAAPVFGQAYPSKPIRVLVPFGPGAPSDLVMRYVAERAMKPLGATFVIDNRVGANGMLAAREAAKAAPDGYTIIISSNSGHAANNYLYKEPGYHPIRDFAPIALLTKNPHVFVIRASLPAQNLKEFIEYGKANPGKLNFGAGNTGAIANAALLSMHAGVTSTAVNYKSPTQAVLDLVGGRIDFTSIDYFLVAEHIRNGSLRALGVTSTTRIKALPSAAPFAETLPGYELIGWLATFAPAGTPREIIDRLNRAFVEVMRTPESDEWFEKQGMLVAAGTPAELAEFQKEQVVKWADMLKRAGVEPQ